MNGSTRIYMIWWDNGEDIPEIYEHDVDRFFLSMEEAERFLEECGFSKVDEFNWRKKDEEDLTVSSGIWRAQVRIFEPGRPEIRPMNPADNTYSPFDNVDDEEPYVLPTYAPTRESTYTLSDGTVMNDLLCAKCGGVVYPGEPRCMTCGERLAG